MKKNIITIAILSSISISQLSFANVTYTVNQDPNDAYRTTTSSNGPDSFEAKTAPVYTRDRQVTVNITRSPDDNFYMRERFKRHHGFGWVPMQANYPVPMNAVIGGGEGERTLYVCHARFHGGVHPGKLVDGRCNISWGGNEISLPNSEVLVSRTPINWISARNGRIPMNAFVGGGENGRPLYICQGNYNGGTHIGKVVNNNCNFGWGGREITVPFYRVLVR